MNTSTTADTPTVLYHVSMVTKTDPETHFLWVSPEVITSCSQSVRPIKTRDLYNQITEAQSRITELSKFRLRSEAEISNMRKFISLDYYEAKFGGRSDELIMDEIVEDCRAYYENTIVAGLASELSDLYPNIRYQPMQSADIKAYESAKVPSQGLRLFATRT
ncbi:MAG: hypothetical protein TREMPRED_004379 [Tremellales sp. Tagirdzhanova-0007]|nr:MAG: hypothetical protein TREMPRED_004379 [Tremellales sp. Tagirdzhanova-0007]